MKKNIKVFIVSLMAITILIVLSADTYTYLSFGESYHNNLELEYEDNMHNYSIYRGTRKALLVERLSNKLGILLNGVNLDNGVPYCEVYIHEQDKYYSIEGKMVPSLCANVLRAEDTIIFSPTYYNTQSFDWSADESELFVYNVANNSRYTFKNNENSSPKVVVLNNTGNFLLFVYIDKIEIYSINLNKVELSKEIMLKQGFNPDIGDFNLKPGQMPEIFYFISDFDKDNEEIRFDYKQEWESITDIYHFTLDLQNGIAILSLETIEKD